MPPSEALESGRVGSAHGRPVSETHAPQRLMRGFSLMRASVGERLGIVAVVLAVLWAAVFWALQ